MSDSIFSALRTFDPQNKLNEGNYGAWSREVEMTFVMCSGFMGHLDGTLSAPNQTTEASLYVPWLATDKEVIAAIYKTIESNAIRTNHIKPFSASPRQTAAEVWASLKQAFIRDSRAHRFELKRRLYNPTHDPSRPVMDYINDIVNAHTSLSDLGHTPPSVDITDSILMHLHSSYDVVRASLVTQSSEPSLETIKKVLDDFYRDGQLKGSGGGLLDQSALYVRKGKDRSSRRKAESSDDDDSDTGYDWGNTRGGDACHRCGRPGHRSSKCIVDMPQKVKDQIIKGARKARRSRQAEKENANIVHMESDAESDGGWGLDPIQASMATVSHEPTHEVYLSEALRERLKIPSSSKKK